MQYSWEFMVLLRQEFSCKDGIQLDVNMNTNLERIADNIIDLGEEGEQMVSDIVQATINVKGPQNLKTVYEIIHGMSSNVANKKLEIVALNDQIV
jgi:hypothetical protein